MTRILRLPDLSACWRMFGLLALLSLLALPAVAADKPASASQDKFAEVDKNNDGKVTLEEFMAVFPGMREEAFKSIDKNSDGVVVREEWEVFSKDHAAGMRPGNMPPAANTQGVRMNNMPGDPIIPPPDSANMPLLTPPDGR